jgi:hypothetical protein
MLAPQTRPEVAELLGEGVPMTPGQIIGGMAKRIEDKAVSLPVVGDAIIGAQRRSVEGFNRAALNRVLKPIGEKATKIGREGLEAAAARTCRPDRWDHPP